jgi:6,7-dimethyl-8-ribityllumazine synthase
VSDNLDESQDWPLRDYSARLRPPRLPEETAEAEPEERPELEEQREPEAQREPEPALEPDPEAAFEPPPTSSAGVEVLYDEDDEQPAAPAETPGEPALQGEAEAPEESVPTDTSDETAAVQGPTPEGSVPAETAAPEEVAEPVEEAEPQLEESPPEPEHAEGDLRIPDGTSVLEGSPNGNRRTVAIVVSKFNGEITNRLLDSALTALDEAGVSRDAVLVMPVPGAFELPIAAMALAKTRRYSCVIALGCVIRGETPHFDFVAGEAASGLQLAGIETGVPVSFGLLTCDTAEQAEERVERGGWAARTALEMADAFAQLRTAVARG